MSTKGPSASEWHKAPSFGTQVNGVLERQSKIAGIHPLFAQAYPIGVATGQQIAIYAPEAQGGQYRLAACVQSPVAVPTGVRAAFPLEDYGSRCVCVVSPEAFDSAEGYTAIFHEFVHCYQYATCEQRLKQTLGIAQRAQARNDFMWEINYSFPYADPCFANAYAEFLCTLDIGTPERVHDCRERLRHLLTAGDFEYMAWQEWKEGFARLIENRIRSQLGLSQNLGGTRQPFERVTFYAGGAGFINHLEACEPHVTTDLEILFHHII